MKSKKRLFFKNVNDQEMNEAFRVIKTNLYLLNKEKKSRVILVTSSIPKEGKSMVASNYAMSLAIAGEKVLLVDCNMRRPTIHEKFKMFFDKGLESVLLRNCEVKDAILRDVRKNLDILPSKNTVDNTMDFFLGERIKLALQEVKRKYTTVILDTSSLIISGDAAILSEYCDGVIYVVGYNQVTEKELKFGKDMLDNAKANIYGFIINKVDKNGFLYGDCGYCSKNYYPEKIGFFERIFGILK